MALRRFLAHEAGKSAASMDAGVRSSAEPPKWSPHSSVEPQDHRRGERLSRGLSLSRETDSLAAETPRLCDPSGAPSSALIR